LEEDRWRLMNRPCPKDDPAAIDAWIMECAYEVTQREFAELVTKLLNGEEVKRGDLMGYAARIGPKFHTPTLHLLFSKKR
jgi:hypothetical protein